MSAKQYYFGGARGIDSDALEHIAKTQPQSIRTVVVPNRIIDQPVSSRAIIQKHATEIIELRNSGPDHYMIRNRYMVDNATRVNAFYDYRGRGGTFNTIEYARAEGKLGTVYSLSDYDIDEFHHMSRYEFHGVLNQMKRYNIQLSVVKNLILHMIIRIFYESVENFFKGLGYIGVKSLEQFWKI